jgi:hypothetical protein
MKEAAGTHTSSTAGPFLFLFFQTEEEEGTRVIGPGWVDRGRTIRPIAVHFREKNISALHAGIQLWLFL